MRRFDFLRFERRRERDEEDGISPKGNCQMEVEVEPYRTHLDSEMCVSELQGKWKSLGNSFFAEVLLSQVCMHLIDLVCRRN